MQWPLKYKWKLSHFVVCFALGKHHQTSEMKQNGIASDKAAEISSVHEHEHSHDHTQLHAYIGVSLVLGFVFMLLVDQIGSSHVHSSDGE
jgi:zinc transporter 9